MFFEHFDACQMYVVHLYVVKRNIKEMQMQGASSVFCLCTSLYI